MLIDKMDNNEITKEVVERFKFKIKCTRCGKIIFGTSKVHLNHNYEMHLLYCQKNKKEEVKNET